MRMLVLPSLRGAKRRLPYACCASYAGLKFAEAPEREGGSNPPRHAQMDGLLRFTRNDASSGRLRRHGSGALCLHLLREQPAEIGQRRVGADGEQLIVRVGVEHLLLCLDDVFVLVKTFLERMA